MAMENIIVFIAAAVVLVPAAIFTGYQILELQGGPTITTFTLDFTDSNGDGKANANENVNMICSATDSNGLNFILLTRKAPDGGSTDYGSGGDAGGATSWTIPSTGTSVSQTGTYEFICTAKNVNGTSTTSTKTLSVVAAQTCTPSSPGSCSSSDSCTTAGGKWCTGSGYSNSYCDVPSASCTTPSMCGNSVCDKGEGSPYGPTMCQQDCGGSSPSPTSGGGACSFDPRPYNTISKCQNVGCIWCSSENICKAPQEQCGGSSPQPTSSSTCNVDPTPYKTESTCKAIGCLWCSNDNKCNAPGYQCGGTGANISSSSPSPISCNTIDPSGCQTQTSCQSAAANWCGTYCSKTTCTQPNTTLTPGPPKITALAFTSQYPTLGETTTAHCDAADSSSVNTIKLTILSPTNKPKEITSTGQGTTGTATITDYLLEEEGQYTLNCEASDWDKNIVTDTKIIKVTREKPPITKLPTDLFKVIKSEILSISGVIEANTPTEIQLADDLSLASGFKKLTLETTQSIPANATIEIKLLDNIPKTDENNRQLTSLKPEQPTIKILQISLDKSFQTSTKAEIEFELTDQELSENNLTPDQVTLTRFTDKWEELPTTYLGKQTTHKFKSTTPGFSVFIVTRKSSTIPSPTPVTDTSSCTTNTDCLWATSSGIWKCGNTKALTLEQDAPSKPSEPCSCRSNKCVPIITEGGKELSLRKSTLLTSLITIEQFKIKFDQLARTTKAIADYYLSDNKPTDYTTWFATSEGFSSSIVKLDNVRRQIKSVKDEPTEQDIKAVESSIDEILKILDSSLDFLLKDILDIGEIPTQDKLIPLAEGQSIKFQINNETHTMTIKSIQPDGAVQVEIASTIQNIQLNPGEEQSIKVADTTPAADTAIKLNKVEKSVAYIIIKSTFFEGIAAKKKIECAKVSSSLTLTDTSTKCLEITADNIVLDGNNKVLDGDGLAYGIIAENKKGITIKNFVLTNYLTGVKLTKITNSFVENNKISSITGIELSDSSNNQIKNNQIQLVRSSGTAQPEDQTPEGQNILLNEIVLVEKPDYSYEPYASITNNIDPADYKDVSGNPLTQLEFTIETTPTTGSPQTTTVNLGKGQTKLVKTGASTTPTDNTASIKIKIISQNGLITQEFTKVARIDR